MATSRDRFAAPSETDELTLRRALSVIQAFRDVAPDMPSRYIHAFLAVAMEPGQGVMHYAEVTGMLKPVTSRILLEIGAKARKGDAGLGLVDSQQSFEDMRAVHYFLTPKGNKLADRVLAAMNLKK